MAPNDPNAVLLTYTVTTTDKDGNEKSTTKTASVKRRVPSFKLRTELNDITLRFKEQTVGRTADAHLPEGISDLEFARSEPAKARENIQIQGLLAIDTWQKTLEMARAIADPANVPPELAAGLASDIDSDFWQSQDLEALEEWVQSFCTRNGIG